VDDELWRVLLEDVSLNEAKKKNGKDCEFIQRYDSKLKLNQAPFKEKEVL